MSLALPSIMFKAPLAFGKKSHGRPPLADLTDADLSEIKSRYLATNKDRKEGSIATAWVLFCESHPDRFGHLVSDHVAETSVPAAVREACLSVRSLVGAARGGPARLRSESACVPGTMRLTSDLSRRLRAGEQFSVDDATRNVACYIPWPFGGCKCSERYGVRLGRWQTLVVHDDASGFVPVVASVFRYAQSYRGSDAGHVVLSTETNVCMPNDDGGWIVEGGVWQGPRVLAVIGGRHYSAKGRPNQKLVEGYFNRLWTRMSLLRGDVGRHRGEIRRTSEIYQQCRQGRKDPRQWFLSHEECNESLYAAIGYLNDKRIDSTQYGKWVPRTRWENDLTNHPRPVRSGADLWLAAPVLAGGHTVRRMSVSVTETGPMGVSMKYVFTAPWLAHHEGRKVDIYFDPLDAWPLTAHIAAPDTRKLLGTAECINPLGASVDRSAELANAVRSSMLSELRIIHTGLTERSVRTPDATGRAIISPALHSSHPSHSSHSSHSPASPDRLSPLPHAHGIRDMAGADRGARETGAPHVDPPSRQDSGASADRLRGFGIPSAETSRDPRQTEADALASLGRRAAAARLALDP